MRAGARLTAEQIEEAKQLKQEGWTFARIGERLGVSYEVTKRALDANHAVERRIKARDRNEVNRFKQNRTSKDEHKRENATSVLHKEDAQARLAEIPPDRRSLTGVYCGDPIFERSALYRKQSS